MASIETTVVVSAFRIFPVALAVTWFPYERPSGPIPSSASTGSWSWVLLSAKRNVSSLSSTESSHIVTEIS